VIGQDRGGGEPAGAPHTLTIVLCLCRPAVHLLFGWLALQTNRGLSTAFG